MQAFGWNLHNRQEIHEEGEAYGRPSYISDSTYVIKTTVHHYVKLHFVRGVTLPNLDHIKALESEFSGLTFQGPRSLIGPGCLTVFFALGTFGALMFISNGL